MSSTPYQIFKSPYAVLYPLGIFVVIVGFLYRIIANDLILFETIIFTLSIPFLIFGCIILGYIAFSTKPLLIIDTNGITSHINPFYTITIKAHNIKHFEIVHSSFQGIPKPKFIYIHLKQPDDVYSKKLKFPKITKAKTYPIHTVLLDVNAKELNKLLIAYFRNGKYPPFL